MIRENQNGNTDLINDVVPVMNIVYALIRYKRLFFRRLAEWNVKCVR